MTTTTTNPQATAREALALIGIEVPDTHRVVLTDCDDTGEHPTDYAVNVSQLAFAVDQHRLITGDSIDGDALTSTLPWL